jgi:hypothetical protein
VFPNPTTGQLFFSNLNADAQLTMYDAQGKVVGTWIYQEQAIQLQVCEGIYYLEAQWNGQKQHKKVLVLGTH